jgi:hypothetical protein
VTASNPIESTNRRDDLISDGTGDGLEVYRVQSCRVGDGVTSRTIDPGGRGGGVGSTNAGAVQGTKARTGVVTGVASQSLGQPLPWC